MRRKTNKTKMEKRKLSKQACCQLAKQLVEEQTEMLKHQTLVDALRKAIREKKKDVIKDMAGGRTLIIRDKRMILLSVEVEEYYGKPRIVTRLGQEPYDAIKGLKLTATEKKLMREYESAFSRCANECPDSDAWAEKAQYLGGRLLRMKNSLDLIDCCCDYFAYDDATDPDFFNATGVEIESSGRGVNARVTKLDDVILRYWH